MIPVDEPPKVVAIPPAVEIPPVFDINITEPSLGTGVGNDILTPLNAALAPIEVLVWIVLIPMVFGDNVTFAGSDTVDNVEMAFVGPPGANSGAVLKLIVPPLTTGPTTEIKGLLTVKLAAFGIVKLFGSVMLLDEVIVTLVALAGIVKEFRLTVPRFTPLIETYAK